MVAKYSVPFLAFEFLQDAGALPGGADGKVSRTKTVAYIVTRENHCVGLDAVHLVNHPAQESGLSVFVHVNIAELHDAKSIEDARQARQGDAPLSDLDPVTFKYAGIERKTHCTPHASLEEAASTYWRWVGSKESHSLSYLMSV
jgi:hypothetical protein